MYELIQAGPDTFYMECPAKIGVWRTSETGVYLIDAGNDKSAGRKVLRILEGNGWTLKGILNTHSNADHIGGNRYLQSQTGCPVFANGAEAMLTRMPLLEPALLYGGYPFAELRSKFLMADASDARELTDPAFPKEIEIIPLPGHFIAMAGFRTPDNVVFLADSLCSEATLQKYGITFLFDISAQLETLNRIEAMDAALFVPAHAAAAPDVTALAQLNRAKIEEIAAQLLTLCASPISFEALLQKLFTHYGLTMNEAQYVLVGSTVRSYLAWLKDTGKMTVAFADNRLVWQLK